VGSIDASADSNVADASADADADVDDRLAPTPDGNADDGSLDVTVVEPDADAQTEAGLDAAVEDAPYDAASNDVTVGVQKDATVDGGFDATLQDASADAPVTGTCGPGQAQCSGNALQTCTSNGTFGAAVPCVDQTCIAGTGSDAGTASCVGACAPGQFTCNGQQPQSCGADGQWQNSGSTCSGSTPRCVFGTGACAASCQSGAGDGGTAEQIVTGLTAPEDIVVDATNIYFTDPGRTPSGR
jgi:hypothetical protein